MNTADVRNRKKAESIGKVHEVFLLFQRPGFIKIVYLSAIGSPT
jgi:hypothetical protein